MVFLSPLQIVAATLIWPLTPYTCVRAEAQGIQVYYRMDLNFSTAGGGSSSTVNSIDDGLQRLRQDFLDELDDRLIEVEEHVDVLRFDIEQSDSECTPLYPSDACVMASSLLTLNITAEDWSSVYEYATIEEVELYFRDFNAAHPGVMYVEFLGPLTIYADVTLRFSPVTRQLNDDEQAILAQGLVEGIGSVGDVDVTGAAVYIQELMLEEEDSSKRRSLVSADGGWKDNRALPEARNLVNYVSLRVQGRCEQGCAQEEFDVTFEEVLEESIPAVVQAARAIAERGDWRKNELDEESGSSLLGSSPPPPPTHPDEGNETVGNDSSSGPEYPDHATGTTIGQIIGDGSSGAITTVEGSGASSGQAPMNEESTSDGVLFAFLEYLEEAEVTQDTYIQYTKKGGAVFVPFLRKFDDPVEEEGSQSWLIILVVFEIVFLAGSTAVVMFYARKRKHSHEQELTAPPTDQAALATSSPDYMKEFDHTSMR